MLNVTFIIIYFKLPSSKFDTGLQYTHDHRSILFQDQIVKQLSTSLYIQYRESTFLFLFYYYYYYYYYCMRIVKRSGIITYKTINCIIQMTNECFNFIKLQTSFKNRENKMKFLSPRKLINQFPNYHRTRVSFYHHHFHCDPKMYDPTNTLLIYFRKQSF